MKLGSFIEKLRGNFSRGAGSEREIASSILRSGTPLPCGPFRFETELPKGVPYEIQTTSDLEHWFPIAQDASRGPGLESNHRFYRVVAAGVPSTNIIG